MFKIMLIMIVSSFLNYILKLKQKCLAKVQTNFLWTCIIIIINLSRKIDSCFSIVCSELKDSKSKEGDSN